MAMTDIGGANYFALRDYISWDLNKGVMRSRGGARLVAFPQEFTLGLLEGLMDECGEAWPIVLYRCGEWWGRRNMERMAKELTTFYNSPMKEMSTAVAHGAFSESWALHGWGRLTFDLADIDSGFLHATVREAPVAAVFAAGQRDAKGRTVDSLLSGVLAGTFSFVAEAEIIAHEIACTARGDSACQFVVGAKAPLADVPEWVRKKMSAEEIGQRLRSAGSAKAS